MPDRTQDLTNHRQVAVACKNYTDSEIKKSEGRILSIVARNNVDFIDHTDEATYRFTAPANSKLLMLQSIAGNSVKYAPTTASDSTSAYQKAIPSYSPSIDRASASINTLGGMSYKINQLLTQRKSSTTIGNLTLTRDGSIWTVNGTTTNRIGDNISDCMFYYTPVVSGHKYLMGAISSNSNILSYEYQNDGMVNSQTGYYIKTANSNSNFLLRAVFEENTTFTNATFFGQIFDLTDMGIDSTSVDTAIAGLLARGINPYRPSSYNAGSIRDTAITSVKSVGVNKFDLTSYINSNPTISRCSITTSDNKLILTATDSDAYVGAVATTNGTSYGVGFSIKIPVRTGVSHYYLSLSNTSFQKNYVTFFGSDDKSIGFSSLPSNATYFSIPSGTKYICIRLGISNSVSGTTYETTIMLNEGNSALPYEPYFSDTLAIDSNIQALDGYGIGINASLYNYVDFNAKKLYGVVKKVDLSTYNWQYDTSRGAWVTTVSNIYRVSLNTEIAPILADKYTADSVANIISESPTLNTIGTNNIVSPYTNVWVYNGSDTITPSGYACFKTHTVEETDISQYLDGNEIEIEPNGTLSFESTYSAYVPSNVSYNGVIKHALATAVKYESFNVWDEEWENGAYDLTTGAKTINANAVRNKNPIEILPNTTYYGYLGSTTNPTSMVGIFFDSNNNFITTIPNTQNTYVGINRTQFLTPSNAKYLCFYIADTQYRNDICINISGTLNGTYKPHKPTYTRALTNNEAKYSWGITTGVRNVRTYCDDEGNAVNEGSLDVNNINIGGLNYILETTQEGAIRYYSDTELPYAKAGVRTSKLLCPNFTEVQNGEPFDSTWNNVIYIAGKKVYVQYTTNPYKNATAFKSAMDGVPLFYEKNTIDTETLDDFDYFFDCEEGDTFTIIGCELLQCYATYSFLIKEAKSNE